MSNTLSEDEINAITDSFQTFCTNDEGKLNIKECIKMMESIGVHLKEPMVYSLFKNLDTEENEQKGGITVNELIDALQNYVGNKNSKEGVRKIFELFLDDPKADVITLDNFKKISRQYGLDYTREQIKDMLERSSKSGNELTFDEFYNLIINGN